MSKYYANMKVNNNTRFQKDLEGSNKNELARTISSIARANCFVGNYYSWYVWDEQGIIVKAGSGEKSPSGHFDYFNCEYLIGMPI